MANAVVIKTRVMAKDVDALNRVAKCSEDLQNGTMVELAFPTEEGSEVFTATKAQDGVVLKIGRKEKMDIAGANLLAKEQEAYLVEVQTGGWMVCSPEVNKDIVGRVLGGVDPRNFINAKNVPFDVIKLEAGDILHVTKEFLGKGATNGQTATLTEGAWVIA